MIKKNNLSSVLVILFIVGFTAIITGMSDLGTRLDTQKKAEILKPAQAILESEPAAGIEMPVTPVEADPESLAKTIKIKSGDTLANVLEDQGVDRIEVAYAVGEIADVFDLRKLRAGQEISLDLEEGENTNNIKSLKFQPSIEELVRLESKGENEFEAKLEEIPLEKIFVKANGEIQSSFYESLVNAGVTDNVTLQLIAAMSFVVDFQREIQPGDKFEILYQAYKNEKGEFLKGRRPVYAKMTLAKSDDVEIFVVEEGENLGYYHKDGASVKKGLLRTPVNGARLSSGYGMRKHPILGYNKMHKGVDFAAPTGTPIYAAGDGIVTAKGRKGAYGHYVRVKHNGTYSTAYAHISKYAKGLKKGKKVKQGQVIAYVGSTGRSTGPHLHYEVLKHGKQINPRSAKLPIVKKLKGEELAKFKAETNKIVAALETSPTKSQLALAE